MADNEAIERVLPDSPHVKSFTNVVRGATPAVWNSAGDPATSTLPWADVDEGSGHADFTGNVAEPFHDGPGRWKQTLGERDARCTGPGHESPGLALAAL